LKGRQVPLVLSPSSQDPNIKGALWTHKPATQRTNLQLQKDASLLLDICWNMLSKVC
jgi:hypothetical protein